MPTIECTNPHALIELVKQNDGFSILPYSLVKESKEITYLKIMIFKYKERIILSCTKTKNSFLSIKKYLSLLKGIMTKNHYSFYYLALIAQRIFVDLALEFR